MQHLCLFAKHWTPGEVKTRLAATIGETEAADIFREFVVTQLARLGHLGGERSLVFSPPSARDAFEQTAGENWRVQPQASGDLGDRMHSLFVEKLACDGDACVLLGCDSPNVPVEFVEQAFAALASVRLVLGPTDDGGYYLIGARGQVPPVFDKMPYSTPQLWAATMDRLACLGWREGTDYAVLPPWYDVDTASDLSRLQGELAALPSFDAHLAALAKRISAN